MTTVDELRQRAVGETRIHVIGIEGTIEAIDADTITIDGLTLPTHLHGPVRYLSDQFPRDEAAEPDHDGWVDENEYAAIERQLNQIRDGIKVLHEENHEGPLTVCMHEVCRRWWWGR